MKEFTEQIIKNLEMNGFPNKQVSLPTEKMFEIADNKGFSFNAVLDELRSEHRIQSDIGDEKIIFSKLVTEKVADPDMMKQAQDMMANMDPAELARMKDMILNMSDKEKEEMMEKAKNMGMI